MTLRGAISGFGAVAAYAHLPGWLSRREVNIVAIHDPAAARRHHAINLIKNVRVYDDLELMLDGEALDFLDIASPPAFHAAAAKLALEANVHVIVEKPLCLNAAELAQLSSLAARNDRLLMCVHNWKYSPAYQRAHELISSGRLGQVRQVSLIRMRDGPAGTDLSEVGNGQRWRLDSKAGGGILIDHGWHAFYLAHWLMGGDEPLSVSSYLRFAPDTGIDDFADLRIEFPGGRMVDVLLMWGAPVRRTTAVIVGTAGLLEIEGSKILLTERAGRSVDYSVTDIPEDSYHEPWFKAAAADYELVLTQGPSAKLAQMNLHEAAAALTLTVSARLSAAQDGRTVSLHIP
ncbi:MAG: Gfo/Idh/MocA family oxidoreductase, partial [Deltaproteobacteria bacterium]|nr:Gfo/Idh/MocA family oxidoreductase [Deltaproteobacteria bacterium]